MAVSVAAGMVPDVPAATVDAVRHVGLKFRLDPTVAQAGFFARSAADWLRATLTVSAVLMPVLVAGSRLYRGRHYPSDVLAGALLACCWLAVTSTVLLSQNCPRGRPDVRGSS